MGDLEIADIAKGAIHIYKKSENGGLCTRAKAHMVSRLFMSATDEEVVFGVR